MRSRGSLSLMLVASPRERDRRDAHLIELGRCVVDSDDIHHDLLSFSMQSLQIRARLALLNHGRRCEHFLQTGFPHA